MCYSISNDRVAHHNNITQHYTKEIQIMENNKKYAYILTEKGWRTGSGYSYSDTFKSDELTDCDRDKKFIEKVKNNALDLSDWDDFLCFRDMTREQLEAAADAEETDIQWEMAIFNIDDYRERNILDPVYKCTAWESELAKEWLAGLAD